MKKANLQLKNVRPEYKRSDFKELERRKYYERVKAISNVVVLDDELVAVFPNSASLNEALHSLVEVAQKASGMTDRPTRRGKQRRAS